MGFTTYENMANPHVTIHIDGCGQIRKHGGQHKYKQGSYHHHETYQTALRYARTTGLPVKNCFFCKPS
jgi:hypothetical protein